MHESTFGKIASALAKAQRAFKPVQKNRVAEVPTKTGGKYSYRYANLADIMEAIRDSLSESELAISQGVIDGKLYTYLYHSSGEVIHNSVPLVAAQGTGPQALGSSLTYSRRYGLCALLGIEGDEDDDGALPAKAAPSRQPAPPPRQTKPQPPAERPPQADYPKANPGWEKEPATDAQRKRLWAMAKQAGYDEVHLKDVVFTMTNKESTKDLTKAEIQKVVSRVRRAT